MKLFRPRGGQSASAAPASAPWSRQRFLAESLHATGLVRLLERAPSWHGLLTLNYHRIGDPAASPLDRDLYSATEAEFDWQVRFLQAHCDVIGPADLERALHAPRGRFLMLTFDDGYADNYESAFQILRAHHATATFFLSTGFLDRPHVSWWDEIAWMVRHSPRTVLPGSPWLPADRPLRMDDRPRVIRMLLQRYKQLPGSATAAYLDHLAELTGSGRCPQDLAVGLWMTWDQVREMSAGGMTFGSHTVTHPILARLPEAEQAWEIGESRRRIEAELGLPVHLFSYPVGGPTASTTETRACLLEAGLRWAFRYGGGYWSPGIHDTLQIPRYGIETYVSRAQFEAVTRLPQVFA